MRFALLGCLLLLVFSAPVAAQAGAGNQAPSARAIELFNQGVAKYRTGDFAASLALFEQSAALGLGKAMHRVGAFHFYGDGVPVSAETGRQWYEKAIALREPDAAFSLAWQYEAGILPRDYAQAMKYYQLAHEFGSAGAGTNIGGLYARGLGVPEDPAKSTEWTRKSAERGDPQGMANLANNYRRGYGVAQDTAQARAWAERAANAGNAWGKEVLAMLPAPPPSAPKVEPGQAEYDQGSKYFFSDKAKAFEWFAKAAALGHRQSRINVAAAYVQGDGVAMDARRGRALFLALAEEGDKYSQRTVAKLMMDGGGGPRDYDGARYWLERAANQDDREAMSLLGMMYDPANNRTPDMDLAVFWYQAAYSRGYSIAEMWLKEKGLLQPPPAQQAFISRIESQGPDRSSSAAFHYDVAVYCQYGGSRCNALRGEAYRFQEANNRAAEAANMQRIWNVYKREAADPAARSECLRKKSESIWRSNSGQQDWYYAGEC